MDTITFNGDDGEVIELAVEEETRINGEDYLLCTDSDGMDEEADAYILKLIPGDSEEENVYEFVEDEKELEYISKIFMEMMDDTDIVY